MCAIIPYVYIIVLPFLKHFRQPLMKVLFLCENTQLKEHTLMKGENEVSELSLISAMTVASDAGA